jgi:hypothetical protein
MCKERYSESINNERYKMYCVSSKWAFGGEGLDRCCSHFMLQSGFSVSEEACG